MTAGTDPDSTLDRYPQLELKLNPNWYPTETETETRHLTRPSLGLIPDWAPIPG